MMSPRRKQILREAFADTRISVFGAYLPRWCCTPYLGTTVKPAA